MATAEWWRWLSPRMNGTGGYWRKTKQVVTGQRWLWWSQIWTVHINISCFSGEITPLTGGFQSERARNSKLEVFYFVSLNNIMEKRWAIQIADLIKFRSLEVEIKLALDLFITREDARILLYRKKISSNSFNLQRKKHYIRNRNLQIEKCSYIFIHTHTHILHTAVAHMTWFQFPIRTLQR